MSDSIFPGGLSPFRTGFLKVALFINGVWVDVQMTELGDDGVAITRGRKNEGNTYEPSSCSFRLKDPTGKWNNRHPSSMYYGLIGRGTPVRVQVELTAGVVLDRWYGEVVTWTPRWGKKGADTAYVEVECAGALRRIGQGSAPLRSPLFRTVSKFGANLIAYWPMEEESDAKSFAPAKGTKVLSIASGSPTLATYTGFAASEALPTLQNGRLVAQVPGYAPGSPAVAQVRWLMRVPAGTPDLTTVIRLKCSGTLGNVDLSYEAANSWKIEGFNDAGASVGVASGWLSTGATNLKQRMSIEMTQSGANVSVTLSRYEVGAANGFTQTGTFTGVTLGSITSVEFNPNGSAAGDVAVGHLTVEKAITSLFDVSVSVLVGYQGENAVDRISRLCTESGLTFTNLIATGSEAMGPQGTKELIELIRECAASDGGMLYEPRSTTDLGYRTLESMLSQTGFTSVPYVDNMFKPFEPVEDDESLRNRVTVTREGGTSFMAEEFNGPLGQTKVGIYEESVTLSLATDAQVEGQAEWRLHMGTVDEARWPTIGFDLADNRMNTGLRDKLLGIGLGSLIEITNLPAWLPPFSVRQIVQGYTERISALSYTIQLNCTPGRPYEVVKYDTTQRWSGEGTTTPALNSTQTTFTVTNPKNVTWTHVDGDYDVLINGEQMTVKDVVNGTDFTVVRSVNGVVKSHAAGSFVSLASPAYWAR